MAEPTHDAHPEPGLFGERKPWVSMAAALVWAGEATPARTLAGNREPRWCYPDRDGTHGRVVALDRRVGGYAADAEPVSSDRPAPTLTLSHGRECWRLTTGNNTERGGGERSPYERGVDRPAPVVDTKAGKAWKLRAGTNDHDVERGADEPAPTLRFGDRLNAVEWRLRMDAQRNATERNATEPAPTIKGGHSHGDMQWVNERPATSVQGDPRIGHPGHKDRAGGESQFAEDAVRISLPEAAILQGFRPDYPFQGTKTSRFSQVVNAVPPTWAAQIIRTLARA